jgi:hypothetical protein
MQGSFAQSQYATIGIFPEYMVHQNEISLKFKQKKSSLTGNDFNITVQASLFQVSSGTTLIHLNRTQYQVQLCFILTAVRGVFEAEKVSAFGPSEGISSAVSELINTITYTCVYAQSSLIVGGNIS